MVDVILVSTKQKLTAQVGAALSRTSAYPFGGMLYDRPMRWPLRSLRDDTEIRIQRFIQSTSRYARAFHPATMRSTNAREAGIAGRFWGLLLERTAPRLARRVPPPIVRRTGSWRGGRRIRLPAWIRAVRRQVREVLR